VGAHDAPITKPVFLLGYHCWEHAIGHHDPVTDIFSLGLLLASVSCSLDFTDPSDVEDFVRHRENLFALNGRLHPVVANVIGQMTQLDRHRRAQDLGQLTRWLENYRDQPADFDLSAIKSTGLADRRKLIQSHLRDRLFEISRRNRLIYFKPTLQTLNLTVASVPVVMDVRNVRAEQLFIWHPELAHALAHTEAVSLGKYLRIEDAPYIPGVLDKIIAEARRDRAEFGFAQLRLVLCFLRWHNLKEEPAERIHSPLLLLPVDLAKRKGVRDQYVLTPTSSEAEVNPALRHHLKTLYGIILPETLDLQATSLDAFYSTLQAQIRASEPGVTLEKIDRPKIELIHARARQRLDQWKKKQRPRAEAPPPLTEYSYDRANYRPRGLRLFLEKIRPRPCSLADLVGAPPRPRTLEWVADPDSPAGEPVGESPAAESPSGPSIEAERNFYELRDGEGRNPYHWSFDLCSLTLGNFHYRKMTLVSDYTKLSEAEVANPAFDSIFSAEPKPAESTSRPILALSEQFPVIPCDAAQAAAVARARDGSSFIIQGPPGTGKSQTITNLIADYVARGKRVLFVCEKRAAIDVVFHRLRQQGLDELCCLIHDSQADKKAFILNLKQTYEGWLASAPDEESIRARESALHAIEHDLAALDRFSQSMNLAPATAGVPVRKLLHRLIELRPRSPHLTPETEELLPDYLQWLGHGALAERLQQALTQTGAAPCFATHPFRRLTREAILHPRPLENLQRALTEIEAQLDAVESGLELSGLPADLWDSLEKIGDVLAFAAQIRPLADREQILLLDPGSLLSHQLQTQLAELKAAEQHAVLTRQQTVHWRDRLSAADTATALEAARRFEASFLRVLQPSYWRLRKIVRLRYDFAAHAVEPPLSKVLGDLQAEHDAQRRWSQLAEKFSSLYGAASADTFAALLAEARTAPAQASLRRTLLLSPAGNALVKSLSDLQPVFQRLLDHLRSIIGRGLSGAESAPERTRAPLPDLDLAELQHLLADLRRDGRFLPELLPVLTELVDAPEAFRTALTDCEIPLDHFEAGSAKKSLQSLYRTDPALTRFDGRLLEAYLTRLMGHHRAWLKSNAAVVRANVRRKFRDHVHLSNLPAAQLDEGQKLFKKDYSAGRHELEHEFGKTMRYKSIRDLAADASGRVLRDLKPIWLMSPLSVSDTLPLDSELFDVVIFDEASQIPVEEAVPALYRAPQVIVVGDEMQLPPTSFFAGSRDSEEPLVADSGGERIEVDLEADSFLSQSTRNLPSTLLAWHYRSRSESLISFSNAAFYAGNLYTIPDRQIAPPELTPISISAADQAATTTEALLARSISFHFLEKGVYEQRRNPAEAAYIAQLVRELLGRETKLSIGIVAFSEAQQSEIERALDELAEDDKSFAARLEAEMNREEDDQFCGLFVKNLENVQGDERDIILLSICYGYDRNKSMLMNFGPINQRGGEKRLNVIFSRARHHMAVISSIRHDDITNDYNDGARALQNFLRYAENLSRGDFKTARNVLENLNPLSRRSLAPIVGRDAVIEELAARLRAKGHTVDLQVGQSRFRCDLAIRSAATPEYQLAVLVDTEAHYENQNLIDRYLTQPGILRAFGWQVLPVLTKDWLHEPDAVLARIERLLRGESAEPLVRLPAASESETQGPAPESAPAASSIAPAPVGPAETKPGAPRDPSSRYLEFSDGDSSKFWEITVTDSRFTVRFGRIGSAGQSQQKSFANETEARAAADQLVASKLKKGYREKR
jgi:predicted DNA-binding WGR domain protein